MLPRVFYLPCGTMQRLPFGLLRFTPFTLATPIQRPPFSLLHVRLSSICLLVQHRAPPFSLHCILVASICIPFNAIVLCLPSGALQPSIAFSCTLLPFAKLIIPEAVGGTSLYRMEAKPAGAIRTRTGSRKYSTDIAAL